jgi:hypothetical protein
MQQREVLVVIRCLEECCWLILEASENPVSVYTDHESLLSALQNTDKGRIFRWQLRLSEYNFQIIHIKGRENVIADGLSRLPLDAIQVGASGREESCLDILLVDAGIDRIRQCVNCKFGKE